MTTPRRSARVARGRLEGGLRFGQQVGVVPVGPGSAALANLLREPSYSNHVPSNWSLDPCHVPHCTILVVRSRIVFVTSATTPQHRSVPPTHFHTCLVEDGCAASRVGMIRAGSGEPQLRVHNDYGTADLVPMHCDLDDRAYNL